MILVTKTVWWDRDVWLPVYATKLHAMFVTLLSQEDQGDQVHLHNLLLDQEGGPNTLVNLEPQHTGE